MVGVSPAYFISRFGDRFGPSDIAAALPDLAALGAVAYQLELFRADTADAWTDAAVDAVRAAEIASCLAASQFVAHFLLAGFATPEALADRASEDVLAACAAIAARFPSVKTVTVPLPAFTAGSPCAAVAPGAWRRIETDFLSKLRRCVCIVGERGLRLALELIPGNLLGGYTAIAALRREPGLAEIGACLDTGLAWAAREDLSCLPARLAGAVYATHLKDTERGVLEARAPGRGDVPWDAVLGGLLSSGYNGGFDVELSCTSAEVAAEFGRGLDHVTRTLLRLGAKEVSA